MIDEEKELPVHIWKDLAARPSRVLFSTPVYINTAQAQIYTTAKWRLDEAALKRNGKFKCCCGSFVNTTIIHLFLL